ncbi:zinc finger protein OZF-like [Anopheles aquasalis]|uniref:zinc finger protein OZF-like n=1 Tax=Anopheles aquasalis TaxID=42839 RepID=UPI00215B258F|nr:zinc finger protein OZF-like [Anopheles aquasalis]
MEHLCRVCMKQVNQQVEEFVSLFQEVHDKQTAASVLNDLFKTEILENECLTQIICVACFRELQNVCTFRDKVMRSDLCFREFTATTISCKEAQVHQTVNFDIIPVRCYLCGELICNGASSYGVSSQESGGTINRLCEKCYERLREEQTPDAPDVPAHLPSDGDEMLTQSTALNHEDYPAPERYCCVTHCKELFENEPELLRHAQEQHSAKLRWNQQRQEATKAYQCNVCYRAFISSKNLRLHQFFRAKQQRRKQFACSQCPFRAANSSLLTIHARSHTGEKPFACGLCKKQFCSELNLKNHQMCHQADRPFVCPYCSQAFVRKGTMEEHIQTCHMDERPYQCTVCSAQFKVLQKLRLHQRIHSGEKQYQCSYCPSKFNYAWDRTRHEKSHRGEKPYVCESCGTGFTRKRSLRIHEHTHTGERPFSCADCEKTFIQSAQLKRHMARYHQQDVIGSSSETGVKRIDSN